MNLQALGHKRRPLARALVWARGEVVRKWRNPAAGERCLKECGVGKISQAIAVFAYESGMCVGS
jgi:hypothetical protein